MALSELEAGLEDENQPLRGNTDDWASLLVDFLLSWAELGSEGLRLLSRLPPLRDAASAAHDTLVRRRGAGLDPADRVRLQSSAAALRADLRQPDLLPAIFHDAATAAKAWPHLTEPPRARDDIEWQLAFLAGVGELQGHDWAVLGARLAQALNLDREPTGEARMQVARRALQTPPATGHSVVWMVFDHASAWGVRNLEPTVTFFDADWLLPNLEHWEESGQLHGNIPPEIVRHRDRVLSSLHRLNPDMPVAFARIDLGQGLSQGRGTAHATRCDSCVTTPHSSKAVATGASERSPSTS